MHFVPLCLCKTLFRVAGAPLNPFFGVLGDTSRGLFSVLHADSASHFLHEIVVGQGAGGSFFDSLRGSSVPERILDKHDCVNKCVRVVFAALLKHRRLVDRALDGIKGGDIRNCFEKAQRVTLLCR